MNEFEIAVVNEPLVAESSKLYCIKLAQAGYSTRRPK